jgi:hypothetical protein
MSGIIIYIPPVQPPPIINPTSEVMPVADGGTFVDSNIFNFVDNLLQTRNTVTLDPKGLNLDFDNNLYEIGDPLGLNINLDTGNNVININGDVVSTPTVIADKFLKIVNNGDEFYLQLYVIPPIP